MTATYNYFGTFTTEEYGIDSETNLAVYVAIGIDVKLGEGNTWLFLDAGHHLIFVDPDNTGTVPVTLRIKF